MPKRIVIDQVFVAQTQFEHGLLEQFDQRMLDQIGIAVIGEARRETGESLKAVIEFSQQDTAAVGARDDIPPATHWKTKRLLPALCFHETASVRATRAS